MELELLFIYILFGIGVAYGIWNIIYDVEKNYFVYLLRIITISLTWPTFLGVIVVSVLYAADQKLKE